MPELFIELLSDEIPAKLQTDARIKIKTLFENKLEKKDIKFKSCKSFSTPKRLVFVIDGIPERINKKKNIIRGPKITAPESALEGFLKANNLNSKDIYKKKTDKGDFYFADVELKEINILHELQSVIPEILKEYSWKKSMKWASYDLNWGRPLKGIAAVFNNKIVDFIFYHLKSSNIILVNDETENKTKKVNNFKSYLQFIKSQNIILDQESRKNIILNKMKKIFISENLKDEFNEKLLEEVVNLVEKPNVILAKFDENYLKIPKEILIITMQKHQKYFPTFDKKNKLTNLFIFVANLPDKKKYIKKGNEKVIDARLSDARFFWEKNKKQSLVKQISKLKNLHFFNKLGTFYDKTQRLRILASMISDQLNINKEKTEIAASICKADLISDLVGEYPELQGVMGKHFAIEQGFDQDIALAVSEHYLPSGLETNLPQKSIGSAVSIIDKLDTLVGFFGINEKPTSSKDPFALRRNAIGLLKIITENKFNIQLKELINYSISSYEEQNVKFTNSLIVNEIFSFLNDRFKNILKEKKIRNDIVDAVSISNFNGNFLSIYKKALMFNKNISKDICKNIISSYKRASNIIEQETKIDKSGISGQPESFLFKKEEEKVLYEKINEIRLYFSSTKRDENYEDTLNMLSGIKPFSDMFFDNVIVNDENSDIKKNRLELLKMFCNTYNNFLDFSKIEGA